MTYPGKSTWPAKKTVPKPPEKPKPKPPWWPWRKRGSDG